MQYAGILPRCQQGAVSFVLIRLLVTDEGILPSCSPKSGAVSFILIRPLRKSLSKDGKILLIVEDDPVLQKQHALALRSPRDAGRGRPRNSAGAAAAARASGRYPGSRFAAGSGRGLEGLATLEQMLALVSGHQSDRGNRQPGPLNAVKAVEIGPTTSTRSRSSPRCSDGRGPGLPAPRPAQENRRLQQEASDAGRRASSRAMRRCSRFAANVEKVARRTPRFS